MRCAPVGRPASWASRRHPPWAPSCAAFRLPRPSTGPGEPGVAGTCLAGQRRTRRLAPDHRPGLNHLRDLRTGQGRGTPPRLYRQAGLSPADGCRRRGCARAGPTPLVAPPTSCVDGGAGALRRGQRNSRCGPTAAFRPSVVLVCCKLDVRFSITIRQHKSLRNLIEAIPEADWTPIPTGWTAPPMWPRPPAPPSRVSPTPHRRLIVRRVKPTPGSHWPSSPPTLSRLHHRPGRGNPGAGGRPPPPCRVENAIRDLKYGVGLNHMPSGRFAANAAWLAIQVMAHNLARLDSADRSG